MPFVMRKLPNQDKYKVYNKITKKVHSYHTTKSNAIKQLHLLRSLSGKGIFSNTINTVKDIGTKLLYGRNDYPPSVKAILDKYKNEQVIQISLRRKPLTSLYGKILNIATNNEFQKRLDNEPKDKLFHISIWIFLKNGKTILAEKNEVIHMEINPKSSKEQEQQNSPPPSNTTFLELFEKARAYIGDAKFFGYSAKDNNCGNWIEYILKSNGIDNQATHDFIGQDAKKLLKGFPTIRKVMNTLTDVAGRANVLLEGGSTNNDRIDNGLNSNDIINILKKKDYHINGVFSKDKLPKELNDGWYVINLQSSNEGDEKGTHWTCFKKVGDNAEYFDAFGFIFPNEVRENIKGHILYSKKEIQDYYSTTCGWFCIGAIVSDNGFGTYQSHFNKYLKMFSSNTRLNDKILSHYLTSKDIQ